MLDCQSYQNFLRCVGGIRVKKAMERLKKFSLMCSGLQLVGA